MGSTRNMLAKAGLAIAGAAFHLAFYVCMAVLVFWIGKNAYQFGFDTFNQHAMNPGEGREVVVTIPQGADDFAIGKLLEDRGLIDNAYVFLAQEVLFNYRGRLQPGTYQLSTAYTPSRIMSVLAMEEEEGT